jgi:hypothetical protein
MPPSVAIIAGTGNLGLGLALRWAQADAKVLLGSRTLEKARSAADRVSKAVPGCDVEPHVYADAVGQSEVVVLSLPLTARIAALKLLRNYWQPDAVLIDTTVPLERSVGGRLSHLLPLWEGSAAQQTARYVPDTVRVTAALHSVSAQSLHDLEQPLNSDVLVVGDDSEARRITAHWIRKIPGARTIDGGPLENARYAEHLAALLISLNLRHEAHAGGVRFTGLPCVEDDA